MNKPNVRPLKKFSQIEVGGHRACNALRYFRPKLVLFVVDSDTAIHDIVTYVDRQLHDCDEQKELITVSYPCCGITNSDILPDNFKTTSGRTQYINRMIDLSGQYVFCLPPISDVDIFELAIGASCATVSVISFVVAPDLKIAARYLANLGASDDDLKGHGLTLIKWPESDPPLSCKVGIRRELKTLPPRTKPPQTEQPIPLTLDQYIKRLRASMVRRWSTPNEDHVHIGVRAISDLRYRFKKGYARYISVLSANSEEAFGVILPGGLVELWVHVGLSRKRYYDIWCVFMKKMHGIDYRRENKRRYHLDHSHNIKSALNKDDAAYVLITPVEASINCSWGFIERAIANDGMAGTNMQFASWFSMPKLLGIRAPSFSKRKNFDEEVDRIRRRLVECDALTEIESASMKEGFDHFAQLVRRGIKRVSDPGDKSGSRP